MNNFTARSNSFVSIIIPVYADPNGLQTTLESAVNQNYNQFEIIISLTPSSGETRDVADAYASKYPGLIHIVEVEKKGRAKARNAGINRADGDIIAFIDANIRMKPGWLTATVSDLEGKEADYLACNVVISPITENSNLIERYDRSLSLPVEHYVEDYNFAPTAALLLTREIIETVGTFDPELTSGEDREFGNRAYDQAYKLYISNNEVYHPPRRTISEHIQKAIRIGIGIEQLRRRYPNRYTYPSLISPLAYAPPHPKRLKSRLSSNNYDPTMTELILFYMFNYMMKLYQQLGRWKYSLTFQYAR